jgi:hypothetical protein
MKNEYIDALLEALNSEYDDFDNVIESKFSNTNQHFEPKFGEVYKAYYPFGDFANGGKIRRCIIVPMIDGTMGALMVSSLAGKEKKLHFKYNKKIKSPLEQGFDKDVFMVGSTVLPISYISLIEYMGTVNDDTYKDALDCMALANKMAFNDPFTLLNWLKSYCIGDTKHRSGNNNENKVQSPDDVRESKRLNCVDCANLVHYACSKKHFNHVIIWTKCILPHATHGHLYTIYKTNTGWHSFDWCSEPPSGQITDYPKHMDFNTVYMKVTNMVARTIDSIYGKSEHRHILISGNMLKEWDRLVLSGVKQKALLARIENMADMETFIALDDYLVENYLKDYYSN